MTKTTLTNDITINKKFKDISVENWDKIILTCRKTPGKSGENLNLNFRDTHLYYYDFGNACFGNKNLIRTEPYSVNKADGTRLLGQYSYDIIASDEAFNDIMKTFPKAKDWIKAPYARIDYANGTDRYYSVFARGLVFPNLFVNQGWATKGNNDLFTYVWHGKDCCKLKNREMLEFLQKYAEDSSQVEVIYPAGMEVEREEVGLPKIPIIQDRGIETVSMMLEVKDEQKEQQEQVAQIEEVKK